MSSNMDKPTMETYMADIERLCELHVGANDPFVLFSDNTLLGNAMGAAPVQLTVGHLRALLAALAADAEAMTRLREECEATAEQVVEFLNVPTPGGVL